MQVKNISVSFKEFASVDELPGPDKQLCLEAEKALKSSHSPYSKFRIGAAVLLQSGSIIPGSNQENVAFPSGLCAERVALFAAGAQHPDDPIVAIAITARAENFAIDSPVVPCGACLQVMAEYERKNQKPIKVILYCLESTVLVADGISNFLPFQFIQDHLGTIV